MDKSPKNASDSWNAFAKEQWQTQNSCVQPLFVDKIPYDYNRINLNKNIQRSERNCLQKVSNPQFALSKLAMPLVLIAQSLITSPT